MVLALFVWKKFSCTSLQGLFPLGTLTSIFLFSFIFIDFFYSRDGFRRKEGTARGLLSISTLQEFQMLTNSFSFSCTVQWQKARNRSVHKVSVITKNFFHFRQQGVSSKRTFVF